MRRLLLIVLVLLLGLGGIWLCRRFFPSDERVIRRTLARAAGAVSVRADQGAFDKLGAINRLLNLCSPDIEIVLNARGMGSHSIQGHDQLRDALAAVFGSGESIEVQLLEIGVEVSEDRFQATAQFIARARGGRGEDDIVQELRVRLKRMEGSWRIQRVEPLPSLEL